MVLGWGGRQSYAYQFCGPFFQLISGTPCKWPTELKKRQTGSSLAPTNYFSGCQNLSKWGPDLDLELTSKNGPKNHEHEYPPNLTNRGFAQEGLHFQGFHYLGKSIANFAQIWFKMIPKSSKKWSWTLSGKGSQKSPQKGDRFFRKKDTVTSKWRPRGCQRTRFFVPGAPLGAKMAPRPLPRASGTPQTSLFSIFWSIFIIFSWFLAIV